jgi:uncharacterized protein (TIGR02300 family)
VAKLDLGTKRICPETGKKFYDLNKSPVVSPYTGNVVPVEAPVRARASEPVRAAPVAQTESVVPETADAEFVSLEDAEAEEQGGKKAATADGEEDDGGVEDAAFIEETEEAGSADVSDIVGDGVEKEEES